jgi:hypothetical protein
MGEAPGPERKRGEQREGAEIPRREAVEKDQPGSSGAQEKDPALSRYSPPMQTLLNVSNIFYDVLKDDRNWRTYKVENCGHMIMLDKPVELAKILLDSI